VFLPIIGKHISVVHNSCICKFVEYLEDVFVTEAAGVLSVMGRRQGSKIGDYG